MSKLLFKPCLSSHLLILQVCLFNLSNIPVHQGHMATNSLIKCEAWKTMIYNGNSFQATVIKMKLTCVECFDTKPLLKKTCEPQILRRCFASITEQLRESSESVSESSALFKVLLCTNFLIFSCVSLSFSIFSCVL